MKSMNYNVSDLGFLKIPSQFKVLKSKLNFLLLKKKVFLFSTRLGEFLKKQL